MKKKKNLTLVTALFDIGRGSIDAGFSRSFDHYLETFGKLLKVDYPMVIFCDEKVEEFVWQHRSHDNTRIVRKTHKDLQKFPFYDKIQKIRTSQKWIDQSGWIVGSPQASLELYNPLVMSKQFFLNDASIFNFFDTKYFAWIDAGLANTVQLDAYFNDALQNKLTPHMTKMLYLAFPYDGQVEVHGFEKKAMNRYAGKETQYVCRGGFFGGTRSAICEMNELYYSLLDDTLGAGYMGTEESIFTLLAYRNPTKVNVQMIESNGLVYKFFEDLKRNKIEAPGDGSIAVYSLTYNLPKQFKLWAESFKEAYPNEFSQVAKYVINNSDDPSVQEEYEALFKEYGFTEFKYDNIGINDGRHAVAKHFSESKEEFMIFFEDDMLLHDASNRKSKLGFCTYYPNIFDTCVDIIRMEALDYLKLSFDEFYGNNLENWGWYNLPLNKREEYFPNGDKRTKITHLGSHRGTPYAVGEFHYCNWPVLFTKQGNRKIFLDTEYAHKYEQTWMSLTSTLQKEGKITAGCLLASIINHNRVYHYAKGTRKENKHY